VSDVFEGATVRLLLADYAAVDAAGKLNVIGGGITLVGFNPQAGLTAPFAVVVSVSVPPELYGAECSVEIVLEDDGGGAVSLPGPAGEVQSIRVGQAVIFERPVFNGSHVPQGAIRARTHWVMAFSTGLPLAIGQRYVWRVRIDHETRPDWTEEFFVPGPMPGPVFG